MWGNLLIVASTCQCSKLFFPSIDDTLCVHTIVKGSPRMLMKGAGPYVIQRPGTGYHLLNDGLFIVPPNGHVSGIVIAPSLVQLLKESQGVLQFIKHDRPNILVIPPINKRCAHRIWHATQVCRKNDQFIFSFQTNTTLRIFLCPVRIDADCNCIADVSSARAERLSRFVPRVCLVPLLAVDSSKLCFTNGLLCVSTLFFLSVLCLL